MPSVSGSALMPVDQAHVGLLAAHRLDRVPHAARHGDLVATLDEYGRHGVQEDAVVIPDD
jgi:hypothetical protein